MTFCFILQLFYLVRSVLLSDGFPSFMLSMFYAERVIFVTYGFCGVDAMLNREIQDEREEWLDRCSGGLFDVGRVGFC